MHYEIWYKAVGSRCYMKLAGKQYATLAEVVADINCGGINLICSPTVSAVEIRKVVD